MWQADVTDYDGKLGWKVGVSNADAAQEFLPLKIPPGRGYASAFYRAKLEEEAAELDRISSEAIWAGQPGYQQEYRVRTIDGEIIWFYEDVNITPVEPGKWHLTGVCTDITERRLRQSALFESEQRYRYMFEFNPHPMWVVDPGTLAFLDVNEAAIENYGYTRNEFLSMTIKDLRRPEEIPDLIASLPAFAARPLYHGIWRHRKKDGSLIDVEITTRDSDAREYRGRHIRLVSAIDITDRLAAQRALKVSEQSLARAQRTANIGSWTHRIGSKHLSVSDEFYRIVGYEPGGFEPTWENCLRCVHEGERLSEMSNEKLTNASLYPRDRDFRIVRPNGEVRHVRSRVPATLDEDGTVTQIQGTLQDITDQKVVEDELRWKSAFLEAQVHSAIDGIYISDSKGQRILQNQRLAELWKIPPQVIDASDVTLQRDHIAGMTREPTKFSARSEHLRLDPVDSAREEIELIDGTVLERSTSPVVDSQGIYLGRIWTCRDITEQKAAERTLRESEASIRAIMESIPHLVWVGTSGRNNEYANERWREYTGLSHEETVGQGWLSAFHPDDFGAGAPAWNSAHATGEPFDLECRLRRFDGEYRWFLVRGVALKDSQGKTIKWFGTCTDIHDRRTLEDELERRVAERTTQIEIARREMSLAKQEAENANLAKSEFLSRMSHELRTPLNAIIGFGQLLDMQLESQDHRESIDYILRGGRHLLDLINEILDISRVESGRIELSLESISASVAVNEVCALMSPLADERRINLKVDSQSLEGCFVIADGQRLKQVLLNLVSNGIKYNSRGGHVELSCLRIPGGRVRIQVSDSGKGLSEAQMKRIFTPFDRLGAESSNIEGTGLGLVLSQRLVSAMRGSLDVHSELGKGCQFSIELEEGVHLVDAEETVLERSRPIMYGDVGSPLRKVLCVEDNASNLRLFEVILQQRPSIRLITAMQGGIGLDLARKHAPDLILLDVHLPDMSGREVLDRLQELDETRDIPVIVVSADATSGQIERLMNAGAKAYVTKPINVEEFLKVMDRFLEE